MDNVFEVLDAIKNKKDRKLDREIAASLLNFAACRLQLLTDKNKHNELPAYFDEETIEGAKKTKIFKGGFLEESIFLGSLPYDKFLATQSLLHMLFIWQELGQKTDINGYRFFGVQDLDSASSQKVNLGFILDSIATSFRAEGKFLALSAIRKWAGKEGQENIISSLKEIILEQELGLKMNAGRKKPRKNFKTKVLTELVTEYLRKNNSRPSFEDTLKIIRTRYCGIGLLIADEDDIDIENRKLHYYPSGYHSESLSKTVGFARLNNQISEIYKKITS